MISMQEIFPNGSKNPINNLNDVEFTSWNDYLTHRCPSKEKYLEALGIMITHTDVFTAPTAIADIIKCVDKYPETKDAILDLIKQYHENCKNPKHHPALRCGFAKGYAIAMDSAAKYPHNCALSKADGTLPAIDKDIQAEIDKCIAQICKENQDNSTFKQFHNDPKYKGILDKCIANNERRTNQPEKDQSKHKSHNIDSVLQEGLKIPFKEAAPELKSQLPPEIASAKNINCKGSSDTFQMEGTDKNGKHAFSFSYNKKTGTYTYAGGQPEKIYSNNPALKFEKLPPAMDKILKQNFHSALNEARAKAIVENGVSFKEEDKMVKVSLNKNIVDFEIKDMSGNKNKTFSYDKETGYYSAYDHQTGEHFSNHPKFKSKGYKELPKEVVDKFSTRYSKAANLARTSIQAQQQQGNTK